MCPDHGQATPLLAQFHGIKCFDHDFRIISRQLLTRKWLLWGFEIRSKFGILSLRVFFLNFVAVAIFKQMGGAADLGDVISCRKVRNTILVSLVWTLQASGGPSSLSVQWRIRAPYDEKADYV